MISGDISIFFSFSLLSGSSAYVFHVYVCLFNGMYNVQMYIDVIVGSFHAKIENSS